MSKSFITFHYNDFGRGDIVIHKLDGSQISFKARTGSVHDTLVHNIPNGKWYVITPSVDTIEDGMVITVGMGWKTRLFNSKREYTHYLFHPDENENGSLGCIVVPNNGIGLRKTIDDILKIQKEIPVFINVEVIC